MVNYDVERGITVFTSSGGGSPDPDEALMPHQSGGKTKSQFVIAEATPADSGNYTCKPSNAVPASIQVFVSNTRGNVLHSTGYICIIAITRHPFCHAPCSSIRLCLLVNKEAEIKALLLSLFLPTKDHDESSLIGHLAAGITMLLYGTCLLLLFQMRSLNYRGAVEYELLNRAEPCRVER